MFDRNDIHDCILGTLRISPLCAQFVNTIEFYRLTHIYMNNADILYPGVRYSRREHCIAVMELSRRWASKLTTDARLIDLIALAGLYHDIGHVTLSHTMDSFLCNTLGLDDHETRAVRVLERVNINLHNPLTLDEVTFVGECITGSCGVMYPPWAYQIVHQPDRSLPDVDRLMYLLHDTYKAGIPCGVDLELIMDSVYIDAVDHHLRYSKESAFNLRYIHDLRQSMFSRVFMHPMTTEYQTFLLSRFCAVFTIDRLHALFSDFQWLELTDVFFWNVLHSDSYTMTCLASGQFEN